MHPSPERTVLQTDRLRLVADPEFGGRIIEIHDTMLGRNLLLEPAPEGVLTLSDGTRYPVSGWDEALPTIEPSEGAPALGHAWRTRADCRAAGGVLQTEWRLPDLCLRRKVRLSGDGLAAEYRILAAAGAAPPLLWAAHVLYPLAGLHRIALPLGHLVPGPHCTEADLGDLLRQAPDHYVATPLARPGRSWKFFVRGAGPVVLYYNDARLRIETDAPWFGVWVNTGLYRPPCIGIEPTNHPTDFLADVDRSTQGLVREGVTWRLGIESL